MAEETKFLDKVGTEHLISKIREDMPSNENITAEMVKGLVFAGNSTGELEDLTVKQGSFVNAGSGWNTYVFPHPFDAAPTVVCTADGYTVSIKGQAADRFLYQVSALGTTTATADKVTVRWAAIEFGGEL